MASPAAFVNQRLHSCKILLGHYQQAVAEEELPLTGLEDCYGVALQLQLLRLYQAYLKELAEQYQISVPPNKGQMSAIELKATMAEQGNHSIEISELADLELQPGWLAKLITANQYTAFGGRSAVKRMAARSDIAIQQVSDDNALELAFCHDCYAHLYSIINRQRDLYMEY